MCGICGIFNWNKPIEDGPARIQAMTASMTHRGPDCDGCLAPSAEPELFLGHRRLAIIYPEPEAAQPMTDPDTGNAVVFNGEIYNFRELQAELTAKGKAFSTGSDTEVLLAAYSQWGINCLGRLRGIFAFAIWDNAKKCLFCARDHLGVKPFYFYEKDKTFLFASEVRTLLASGMVPRTLCYDALDSLLAYGSVQEPRTLVEGVRSMPAGSYMLLDENWELKCRRYWNPELAPFDIPEGDMGELVTQSLLSTVEMQLFSDVPLGVFLSGGIDSSSVASLIAKSGKEVQSFTVALEDDSLDESREAAETAAKLGIKHHQLLLTKDFADEHITAALDSYDQPGIDGLNTWFISNLVHSQGIKVVISGLGGDEVFAGYDDFRNPRRLMSLAGCLKPIPGIIRSSLKLLLNSEKWRKVLDAAGSPVPYIYTRQILSRHARKKITGYTRKPLWMQDMIEQLSAFPGITALKDNINRISLYELNTYMRSTLLRDADQMGMANSLEIRVPLIDHKLVELMLRIPGNCKLDSKIAKKLLVQAANLDEDVARRPKRGFNLPINQYLENSCVQEASALFTNPPDDCFNRNELLNIWKAYRKGRYPWQRIWTLYTAMRWIKKYLG